MNNNKISENKTIKDEDKSIKSLQNVNDKEPESISGINQFKNISNLSSKDF